MRTAQSLNKGGKSRAMKRGAGLKKGNAANARSKMCTKFYKAMNAKARK
jgi:hypothetical protein